MENKRISMADSKVDVNLAYTSNPDVSACNEYDWTKDFPADCLVFCFLLLFALAIRRRRGLWHNLTRQAFQHECTQCLITSLPGQLVLILL